MKIRKVKPSNILTGKGFEPKYMTMDQIKKLANMDNEINKAIMDVAIFGRGRISFKK